MQYHIFAEWKRVCERPTIHKQSKTNTMTKFETINPLSPVKNTLENLRIGESIKAPRYQRASIRNAIARIADECPKKYSITTLSEFHINIKRVR